MPSKFPEAILAWGVNFIDFSYPVVPEGKAPTRTEISADNSQADLMLALDAFGAVKKELGL
jgi:glycine C-acetyltransferase